MSEITRKSHDDSNDHQRVVERDSPDTDKRDQAFGNSRGVLKKRARLAGYTEGARILSPSQNMCESAEFSDEPTSTNLPSRLSARGRLSYRRPPPEKKKTKKEEAKGSRWAIKITLGGGAGHAGVGGAFCLGELKNLKTGKIKAGQFMGFGIGLGLATPGADPGWGSWVEFHTPGQDVDFEDFNGTAARLTTVSIGAAIIGYSAAWISFPMLDVPAMYVGGFNMGSVGVDAGTNAGVWNVAGI